MQIMGYCSLCTGYALYSVALGSVAGLTHIRPVACHACEFVDANSVVR